MLQTGQNNFMVRKIKYLDCSVLMRNFVWQAKKTIVLTIMFSSLVNYHKIPSVIRSCNFKERVTWAKSIIIKPPEGGQKILSPPLYKTL